jgi:hypothetical protein
MIGKIMSYTKVSIDQKEMGFVANGEDVNDYISNNVNVIEIKWDPLGDNITIQYEDFYKFINKKEYIYLFQRNAFLDYTVKKANIYLITSKIK